MRWRMPPAVPCRRTHAAPVIDGPREIHLEEGAPEAVAVAAAVGTVAESERRRLPQVKSACDYFALPELATVKYLC